MSVGLFVLGYFVLLFVADKSDSRSAQVILSLVWIVTGCATIIRHRQRLAAAHCPHDGVLFEVNYYRLPRALLTCPACGRTYELYGPQLYEKKPAPDA